MTEDEFSNLTDGSAKIFGMENFGNTCYCNSVLQCLYYSKPFRENVLSFPPKPSDRTKKLEVPGKTPHPFTVDPNAAVLNTSTSQHNNELGLNTVPIPAGAGNPNGSASKDNTTSTNSNPNATSTNNTSTNNNNSSSNSNSGFGRKMNFFKSKDDENSNPAPTIAEQLISKEPPAYAGLAGLTLGLRFPGQNLPVVGFTDDPFATPEQKKRSALVKGPIINMDLGMSDEYKMNESLFTSVKDIFESMSENSSRIGVVSPSRLIEVLKRDNEPFRSSMHQDAHEFFNFTLNEVIDSVDRQTKQLGLPTVGPDAPNRWVHDLFEGLLTSETKCLTCENVSRRDEQFLDLSIDLERNTSVTACLRQFSASEMLCERNKFHCDNCGGLQEAEKRMKVKKLPKILALHLKRFKFTEDMQRNLKLFHRVVYPKHFRLFNTTYDAEDPDKLYELSAVVVHIGGGPYHGHYVSVVKTEHSGWLLFDDEMVESVDPNYVFNFFGDNKGMATAYVLFYQEVSSQDMEKENLFTNEPEQDNDPPRPVTPPMTPHKIDEEEEHHDSFDPNHEAIPVSRVRTTGGTHGLSTTPTNGSTGPGAAGVDGLRRHTSQPTPTRTPSVSHPSASNGTDSPSASTSRSGSKKEKKRGLSFSFKKKASS